MRFYQIGFLILTSFSLISSNNNTEQYISSYGKCAEAFIEYELLNNPAFGQEEAEQSRLFLKYLLENILRSSANICTEDEFQLIADATCYAASNNMCRSDQRPKFIELPPFSNETEFAPKELLKLIGERKLTPACIDAIIL